MSPYGEAGEKSVPFFWTGGFLRKGGMILTITPNWRILGVFVHIFKKKDLQEIFRKVDMHLEKLQNMRGIAYYCKARR